MRTFRADPALGTRESGRSGSRAEAIDPGRGRLPASLPSQSLAEPDER
jgi:hypothetical protein